MSEEGTNKEKYLDVRNTLRFQKKVKYGFTYCRQNHPFCICIVVLKFLNDRRNHCRLMSPKHNIKMA